MLYTDDSILAGPVKAEIDQIIADMKGVNLEVTFDGDISDFLGVKITKLPDSTIELTQPHLIESILRDLRLDIGQATPKDTPASVTKTFRGYPDSDAFDRHFDYRSVVGKLNQLEKTIRPDISYSVHQRARYCSDTRQEHGEAVKWLGRYLLATSDK